MATKKPKGSKGYTLDPGQRAYKSFRDEQIAHYQRQLEILTGLRRKPGRPSPVARRQK